MSKAKRPKVRKGAWFIRVRGSYLPSSWQGWLSYIPFVAFLIWTLVWAVNSTSSLATIVFTVFPAWIAAAVVMTWLATRMS